MDLDAQQVSVAAGAVVLLACGAVCLKRRWRSLVAPVAAGVAVGAILYPLGLGLAMGYGAALREPPRLFWSTFWDVGRFYAAAPVFDTIPRGASLGLLFGLVVGLLRAARRRWDAAAPLAGPEVTDD